MNEDPESDFVMCTYRNFEGNELLSITEELPCITVVGDHQDWLFDNGCVNEKRDLWPSYQIKKIRNSFSCTRTSLENGSSLENFKAMWNTLLHAATLQPDRTDEST